MRIRLWLSTIGWHDSQPRASLGRTVCGIVWFIATALVATFMRPEFASLGWNVVNVALSISVSPLPSVTETWTCIDDRNGASRPFSVVDPTPSRNGDRSRPSSWKLTWPGLLKFDIQTSFSPGVFVMAPAASTKLRCGSPTLRSTWQPMQLWIQLPWHAAHSSFALVSSELPCVPANVEPCPGGAMCRASCASRAYGFCWSTVCGTFQNRPGVTRERWMIAPPFSSKNGCRSSFFASFRSLPPFGPEVTSVARAFAPWQSSHSISIASQFVL